VDKFEIPEALGDLSDEARAELEANGVAAFDALGVTRDSDADTISAAEQVVEAVTAIRAEKAAARHAVPPTMKEKRVHVITAAAETGFAPGAELDSLTAAGQAWKRRLDAISKGSGKFRQTSHAFSIEGQPAFMLDGSEKPEQVDAVLADAVKDRLYMPESGSLTAAAGWSSPSETMYDLCVYESAVNLLDLPEVGVSRGGVRFTREPAFGTIYSAVGFDLTEAQVQADTSKSSASVPEPAFVDLRLDAVGIVVRAGILQNAAYPELVRRYIEGALVAHQYKVNAKMIAAIDAAAGAALTPADESALYSSMDALAFVARSQRQLYRLPESHVVNVVVAMWVKESFKADIARRTGRPSASVADAELNEWFTTRNLRPQFVYGLDELTTTTLQVKGKATTPVYLYPEGTFVKLTSPVIDLSAVYDSTLLDTNVYTAAFVEQGVELAHRCLGAAEVTLPVDASGRTGAADLVVGHGAAEA